MLHFAFLGYSFFEEVALSDTNSAANWAPKNFYSVSETPNSDTETP